MSAYSLNEHNTKVISGINAYDGLLKLMVLKAKIVQQCRICRKDIEIGTTMLHLSDVNGNKESICRDCFNLRLSDSINN